MGKGRNHNYPKAFKIGQGRNRNITLHYITLQQKESVAAARSESDNTLYGIVTQQQWTRLYYRHVVKMYPKSENTYMGEVNMYGVTHMYVWQSVPPWQEGT